jgi:hypothetical protein
MAAKRKREVIVNFIVGKTKTENVVGCGQEGKMDRGRLDDI